MARQKRAHWLYCPVGVYGIRHKELWKVSKDGQWMALPVLANPDYLGALVGDACPDGVEGYDNGIIAHTRKCVRAWIVALGRIDVIVDKGIALGYDWSGIATQRRKAVLAAPDGTEVLCPITDALLEQLTGLRIFREVRKGIATARSRDVLRDLGRSWSRSGDLILGGVLDDISRGAPDASSLESPQWLISARAQKQQ